MIFQLFHPMGEIDILYLVALLRYTVVTTVMFCKELPECQRRLPQAKQSTAHQVRERYRLRYKICFWSNYDWT